MRRLVVLGIAVVAGCMDGPAQVSTVDGFWRAGWDHELTLSSGRYVAADRDQVGLCRVDGAFALEGDHVALHLEHGSCDGMPQALEVDGDQLVFGVRVYVRADPAVHETDWAGPPIQR